MLLRFILLVSLVFPGFAHAADAASFDPLPVYIQAKIVGGGVPVGTVVAWPSYSMPIGNDAGKWLECNGQSTAGYPELAAVVGGAVPNYQGYFLRGVGGASAALGEAQGDSLNANYELDMMLKKVGMRVGGLASTGESAPSAFFSEGYDTYYNNHYGGSFISTPEGVKIKVTLGGGPETRPVNKSVRYLIRAKP